MGRLKTVHQTQHASRLELKFFEGPSKVADQTKIRRQQRNNIILKGFSSELYPCTVLCFGILAKFVSTPHCK